MVKRLIASVALLVLLLTVLSGVGTARSEGVLIDEVQPVNPGECLKVQVDVYHSVYVFGCRLPFTVKEKRTVVGATVNDLESGKLIGRYHDLGAKICPHCNGTGEVNK